MSGTCYLHIKKIGIGTERATLELYIDNCLIKAGIEDVDVSSIQLYETSAIIEISRPLLDFELNPLKEAVMNKQIGGSLPILEEAPCTIAVTNLKEDLTAEDLELYFESPKYSGGGDVERVKFFEHALAARIHFKHEKDMLSVLDRKHNYFGPSMKVFRCSPEWSPAQTKPAASKPTVPVYPPEMMYSTSNYLQPESDYLKPVASDYLHPVPANNITHDNMGSNNDSSARIGIESMSMDCEENIYEEIADPVEKTTGSLFPFDKPRIEFTRKSILKPKPQAKVTPTPVVLDNSRTETMKIPLGKYIFLKEYIGNLQTKKEDSVEMDIDEKGVEVCIKLIGTETNVDALKIKIYEAMTEIAESSLRLTKETVTILNSAAGKSEVERILLDNKFSAKLVDINKRLVIYGKGEESAKAADFVQNCLGKFEIKLEEHHKGFIKSKDWKDACASLQEEGLIIIKMNNDSIELHGFKSETKKARRTIEGLLKKNSFKKESIELKKGVYRFLKMHCQDEISSIAKSNSLSISLNVRHGKWFMDYQGCADEVTSIKPAVIELRDSILYDSLECGKPGLAPYFLNEKDMGYKMVMTIEPQCECTVEIRPGAKGTQSSGAAARFPTAKPQYEGGATARPDEDRLDVLDFAPREKIPKRSENIIKVIGGDITTTKADVLVNSIATDKVELAKCGKVANAFGKAGGPAFEKEFASFGGLKCGEVKGTMVTTGSSLKSSLVLHVGIRPWQGPRTYKMLKTVIEDCIKQVHSYGLKSIAFPTIGCGFLKYPIEEVIKCFKEASSQAKSTEIIIVAFEDSIYDTMKRAFQPSSKSASGEKMFRHYSKEKVQSVIFHINAKSKSSLAKAKDEINGIIKRNYKEVHIRNDSIEYLETTEVQKILRYISDLVAIEIDLEKKFINIKGEKDAVFDVNEKIDEILKKATKKQRDPKYVKKSHGVKGYLKALADENNVYPKHWTKYTSKSKEMWRNFIKSHKADTYLVTVDAKTKHAVEQLMMKTWDQQYVGHGADATGLGSVQGIQVTKVERIENPELYKDYYEQLKKMCEKGSMQSYNKITQPNIGEPEVKTATLNVDIDATRVPEINEYFLFHGTKNDVKEHIVLQGLDTRMGSNGLFGRGTYFAESSTKADQYSDKKNARTSTGTELVMVVARVLLGNVWHQKGEAKCNRPPCTTRNCHKSECHHPERFNSMLGTHKGAGSSGAPIVPLNFREFVIYDPHRAYPEFIVSYKRL